MARKNHDAHGNTTSFVGSLGLLEGRTVTLTLDVASKTPECVANVEGIGRVYLSFSLLCEASKLNHVEWFYESTMPAYFAAVEAKFGKARADEIRGKKAKGGRITAKLSDSEIKLIETFASTMFVAPSGGTKEIYVCNECGHETTRKADVAADCMSCVCCGM